MGINTCLSDSFAVLQAEEQGTSFGRIIVWGTYGWALSALVQGFVNQIKFLPRLVPGLLTGTVLLTIDAIIVSLWRRNSDFKLDSIPIKAAQTLTSSSPPRHKEPSDYQPQNESALINLGMEQGANKALKRQTKSPVRIMLDYEQPLRQQEQSQCSDSRDQGSISGASHTDDFSRSSSTTMVSEDDVYNTTNKAANRLNKPIEVGEIEPNQSANCASFRLQLVMLGFILKRRRSLVRFLILFIISGFFMSMHWNYFFLFLEDLHGNNFEIVSAFSMICQSIIGELPFFILSRKVIDFFGRSHTLSVVFISMGLRFLLYAFLLPTGSAYLVIVADCLQGPNYGLFYVVMTEVGLEFSYCDDETVEMLGKRGDLNVNDKRQVDSVRLLLKSTIQSVAFACYEGIGLGLGSIVGGFILVNYSFKILWSSMAATALLVGITNSVIELNCRDYDPEEERSDRREFVEANARGLIERVASPTQLVAKEADSTVRPAPQSKVTFDNRLQRQTKFVEDDQSPGIAPRKRTAIARKSAGGPVAPPAAIVSMKQQARFRRS